MLYLHRFISAFVFTEIVEVVGLFLFFRYFFSRKEIRWMEIIFTGFFASFSTIPYVWFVFPFIINWSYSLYIIISELFALIIEAVLYHYFLKLDWKMAFLVSFLCNLASFLLGSVLQLYGIWIYW